MDAVLPVRTAPANQTNPKALAAAVVDAVAGTDSRQALRVGILGRAVYVCFSTEKV